MKESKEKRAGKTKCNDDKRRLYHYLERQKVTTYSATHKPNYGGKDEVRVRSRED